MLCPARWASMQEIVTPTGFLVITLVSKNLHWFYHHALESPDPNPNAPLCGTSSHWDVELGASEVSEPISDAVSVGTIIPYHDGSSLIRDISVKTCHLTRTLDFRLAMPQCLKELIQHWLYGFVKLTDYGPFWPSIRPRLSPSRADVAEKLIDVWNYRRKHISPWDDSGRNYPHLNWSKN